MIKKTISYKDWKREEEEEKKKKNTVGSTGQKSLADSAISLWAQKSQIAAQKIKELAAYRKAGNTGLTADTIKQLQSTSFFMPETVKDYNPYVSGQAYRDQLGLTRLHRNEGIWDVAGNSPSVMSNDFLKKQLAETTAKLGAAQAIDKVNSLNSKKQQDAYDKARANSDRWGQLYKDREQGYNLTDYTKLSKDDPKYYEEKRKAETERAKQWENWLMAEYLLGDQSTDWQDFYNQRNDYYNALSDEEYYKEEDRLDKQFRGLDWQKLMNPAAPAYQQSAEEVKQLTNLRNLLEKEQTNRAGWQAFADEAEALASPTMKSLYERNIEGYDPEVHNPQYAAFLPYFINHAAGGQQANLMEMLSDNIVEDLAGTVGVTLDYDAKAVQGYYNKGYDYLLPEEIEAYNRLYASDPARAQELLDFLEPQLLERRAIYNAEETVLMAQNPVLGTLMSGASILSQPYGAVQSIYGAVTGEGADSAMHDITSANQVTRQTVGEEWGKALPFKIFGEEAGTAVYNVLMSMGDMLMANTIGGAAGKAGAAAGASNAANIARNTMQTVMSSEVMAGTIYNDMQQGYTNEQAVLHGLTNGVIEAWMERGFMDELFSGKSFSARNIGGMLAEGGEEIGTDILQTISGEFAAFLTGREGEIQQVYEQYKQTLPYGEDPGAATLMHYANQFALSGMSGMAMGGGVAAVTGTGEYLNTSATGADVKNQGAAEAILSIAEGMNDGSQAKQTAAKIREKQGKNKRVTNYQLGQVTQQLATELDEENSRIVDQVMDDAITDRLVELGEDAATAKKNASAIRKVSRGQKLTMDERAAVDWTPNATQVVKELSRETADQDGGQRGEAANAPNQKATAPIQGNEAEGQRTGQKWVTAMQKTADGETAGVRGKQLMMRAARSGMTVSSAASDAVKNSAAKVKVNKNGKVSGKTTSKAVNFTDNGVETEGKLVRFEKKNGQMNAMVTANEITKSIPLEELTQYEGSGVAAIAQYIQENDGGDRLHDMSTHEANAMLNTYQAVGGDARTFIDAFEETYLAGYAGVEAPTFAVNPGIREIAYAEGQREAQLDEEARKERAGTYRAVEAPQTGWLGKVTNDSQLTGGGDTAGLQAALDGMTEPQRATAEAAMAIGNAAGLNVVLYESDLSGGKIANGKFSRSSHTIYLDVNAGAGTAEGVQAAKNEGSLRFAIIRTMGHELTHYLEAASPEMYAKYKQAVREELKANAQDMAVLIREKLDRALDSGRKLTYAGAEAEVIADASEYMLEQSTFVEKMDGSLKGRVKQWIQGFMEKIRTAFSHLVGGHKESATLRRVMDGVRQYTGNLQALWDASLMEAAGRPNAPGKHAGEEMDTGEIVDGKHYKAKHAGGVDPSSDVYYGKHRVGMRRITAETNQSGEATEMVEEQYSLRDEELSYASAEDEDFHRDGRIYDYDFMVEQQPISLVVIPSVNSLMKNGRFSRAEIVENGKETIPGEADENGHKKVVNAYTGRTLTITNSSIRHGLNGDKQRLLANAQIGMVIGDVVKNGIPVNGLVPTDRNAMQTYAMVTPCITEDGKQMMAVIHVDIQKNEVNSVTFTDIVHSTNGRIYKNSELVSDTIDVEGLSPYHPSRYTISIADLLRDVNKSFNSLLSKDVLKHLGEERNENGVYAEKVLYSLRDEPDEVSLRGYIAEAGDDVASTIEEKNALQIYRDKLKAYQKAVEATQDAEQKRDEVAKEKGWDAIETAKEEGNVRGKRRRQKEAYNALIKIEETPHVQEVIKWTRDFITDALSGSTEEISRRQAEAEANLAELESQYEELKAAGRTQMATETKKSLELQKRYARNFKSKVAEGIQARKEEYRAREQKAREYRYARQDVEKLRRGIGRKVKRLNTLRVRETDQKHVPQELQHVANLVMQTFTDSSLSKLAFAPAQTASLARRYRMLREVESDTSYYWDDEIEEQIGTLQALGETYTALRERQGGVPSNLSLEGLQLETEILNGVDNIVSNVLWMIDSANDAFLKSRAETFEQYANQAGNALLKHKNYKQYKGVLGQGQKVLDELLRKGNMTPIYFFEHMRNPEMKDVFDEVRRGQSTYAQIVAEGKTYVQEMKNKYHYGAWVGDGVLKMKTGQGHSIELTREEAAEIYAIAEREKRNKLYQTEHLLTGGFQYKNTKNKGDGKTEVVNVPNTLNAADLEKISNWLTADQKAYADALVSFLSNQMAEYGNAASMAMYGYKKFTEKYYIPFHTVAEQRFQRGDEGPQGDNAGTGRLKNSGFTKKLQHKANAALYIGGLTDTVAEHIHKMATYAAMVEPVENMKRLLNHKVISDDGTINTIRALIGQKYGRASQDYMTKLLQDLNGAAQGDERATKGVNALIGAFKRGAVLASASVVLQQPTAAARAMAYISPKYFAQNPFYRPGKGTWDELTKYAGTAVIKDMGKFDVGMGLTASQYISDEHLLPWEAYRRLKEESKMEAGKEAYRRAVDWLTAAPGKADQWTWGLIWKAVKAEQAALNPKMDHSSEEFLQMCGERFDDVIDHTQVYDSVLTRSNLMRSTNAFHKMATSFMSEPTLSINMLYDALAGDHSKGKRAAIIGGVITSQVLAGAMAALAQAWNDDEDKRNWAERYTDRAVSNITDNLNPLGMIPYVADAMSAFAGYEVERPDMSVVKDVIEYASTFFSKATDPDKKLTWKDYENFIGTIANLTGLPAKNISREMRRTWNMVMNSQWTTPNADNLGFVALESTSILGVPVYSGKNAEYYERMVNAHLRGDEEKAEDYRTYMLTSKMVNEDTLRTGLKTAMKEAFLSGETDEDTAIQYLLKIGSYAEEDDAYWEVDKWQYMRDTGSTADSYRKYADFFQAVETGTNLKATIQVYLDNGVSKTTLASQITNQYKKQLIALKQSGKGYADLQARILTAYEALGYDRAKKLKDIQKWFE